MVADALVEEMKDEGRGYLNALHRDGFAVAVAAWAKTTNEQQWYLCVAAPAFDALGSSPAYAQAYGVLDLMHPLWLRMFDVKLISPNDPIARDLLEIRRQYARGPQLIHVGDRVPMLGNLAIEEAWVYP